MVPVYLVYIENHWDRQNIIWFPYLLITLDVVTVKGQGHRISHWFALEGISLFQSYIVH
jgi:hypothetical protein